MIFGIGADIVRIERIEHILVRHGERFVERLLMPAEAEAFSNHTRPARFLAMRFAAKEAIVKAMGTGFAHGMWLRDAGVASNEWGRPEIIWSDRGREMCEKLGIGEGHITLTDEAGLVVAMAVLMKKSADSGQRTVLEKSERRTADGGQCWKRVNSGQWTADSAESGLSLSAVRCPLVTKNPCHSSSSTSKPFPTSNSGAASMALTA